MSTEGSSRDKKGERCSGIKNHQTKQSRDKKTKEVIQLSFLIWILNKKISFTFQKPRKRSVVNVYFPDLIEIDFGKDKMNITQFLNERVENDYDKLIKDKTPKQVNRIIEHTKKVYLNNYLTDLAIHDGIKIESKATQKETEQMERFLRIEFDGKVFDQKEIMETGVEINLLMMNLLGENSKVCIPKGKLHELYTHSEK